MVALMLAMWFDSIGVDSVGEGEPQAESSAELASPFARLLVQLAFGLPGLAPLLLNKVCGSDCGIGQNVSAV